MVKDISLKYKIRVKGTLNSDWKNIFPGFEISTEKGQGGDIVTTITGMVKDPAQLYGIFSKMRDMGCVILDVNQIESEKRDGWSSKNNE